MSDPKCFLAVSRMKIFISVLSIWFSTLANYSAPTKKGIENKCYSRKCRLLMPFTFHYRANVITCKSRLQGFLNCAALVAVWRKTNGTMHPNFKDGCQTLKARERYQKGIFEVPHSIKSDGSQSIHMSFKNYSKLLKIFLLYFCFQKLFSYLMLTRQQNTVKCMCYYFINGLEQR